MKLDSYFSSYTKLNSRCIKDLNIRLETIILLEENIGKALQDISVGKDFMAKTSKAQTIKKKKNRLGTVAHTCNLSTLGGRPGHIA